jgi:hypothetical protein
MAITCTLGLLTCAIVGLATPLSERLDLEPTAATSAVFLLAAVTIASTAMPWITGYRLEHAGLEYARGVVVAASATILFLVAVLHARCEIDDHTFKVWSVVLAGLSLAVSMWVYTGVAGSLDPVHERTMVDFFVPQRLDAADGLHAAMLSSALVLLLPFGLRSDADPKPGRAVTALSTD